ncbi:hypothetical protein CTI12_AA113780 [Artemisia annua]|uniref:FAE domain-containing protein n=1 Tax=Artemisia annua TaxID=35608 RepID=A0A2U1P157_ARTAN|nr:hypothetical protein CTI12_AA113780 [Artemisia annua]
MFIISVDWQKFPTHPVLNSKTEILYLAILLCVLLLWLVVTRKTSCKVYLIDFACYKPPTPQQCTKELVMKQATQSGYFSEKTLDFFKKALERSGLGDSTYLAEHDSFNRYKLRENVITYNLVGMGCSAGLLAIGLAKQLIQVHKNSYALIVSTESITENCYIGKERSKFLINCLFRVGGAAILLSNHSSNRHISKYKLLHAVHTNTSSSDRSYNCIIREEDSSGIVGISINKDLLHSAIGTIEPNLAALDHLILPFNEKFTYVINYIARKIIPAMNIHPYVPTARLLIISSLTLEANPC